MRAGNRGEMRLRIANGANPMLESAADGGIQRGERRADSSSLLGFLQQAILHDFTRQKHACFEGCVVKTRSNHFQRFCFFFFAALAVDDCVERAHRSAFPPDSSFPSSLPCLLQQTITQYNAIYTSK